MRASFTWLVFATAAFGVGACSILFDGSSLTGGSRDGGAAGADASATDGATDASGDGSAGEAGTPCSPEGSPCPDDGDACTSDVCQSGACVHTPLGAGSPCSATNVCDDSGQCSQGCGIQAAFYTPGTENPKNACEVCDPTKSRSAWTSRIDNTPCTDDSNVCTSDYCAAGVCLHAPQATGSGCGSGKVCDDTSQCSAGCFIDAKFVPDGTVDPDDPCKVCDASQSTAGWVVAANGAACPDDGNPCTADACQNDACKHTPVATNTPCGNGGKCLTFGTVGFCNVSCSIGGKSFAEGAVNPANTCETCQTAVSKTAWTPLSDGSSCGTTSCTAYAPCSYSNDCATNGTQDRTCTDHACNAGKCLTTTRADPKACSRSTDGAACTDDGSACTSDVCAGSSCTHPKSAAGSSCGSGQICDGNGSCIGGCYISGAFYADGALNPTNPCMVCDAASSTSSWSNAATGTACPDDGNKCTTDTCSAGACTHPDKPNGSKCGLFNVCGASTCQSGTCTFSSTCKGCCDGVTCYPGPCP